jgi:hypothetical protein
MSRIARPLRVLGPYAAIELVVPGGTLLALSLWAFRHRAWFSARVRRAVPRWRHRKPVQNLTA